MLVLPDLETLAEHFTRGVPMFPRFFPADLVRPCQRGVGLSQMRIHLRPVTAPHGMRAIVSRVVQSSKRLAAVGERGAALAELCLCLPDGGAGDEERVASVGILRRLRRRRLWRFVITTPR